MNFWKNWMLNVQDKPLNELLLLGSHDSASYVMNFKDTPKLKSEPFDIRKIGFIPTIETSVKSWSITQSNNFYEQCMNGIRVFDLRCSTLKQGTVAFWLEHSYATVELIYALVQLNQFCIENPSEILILWFRIDDWPFILQKELLELWKPYFNIMFNHKINKTTETVESLTKNSVRWLVYGNRHLDTLSCYFGNYQTGIISPWIDVNSPILKIQGLKKQLLHIKEKQYRNNFYGLSWTLTPELKSDILSSIFKNLLCDCCSKKKSLEEMATNFNLLFETFGKENENDLKTKVNIIWIDFPKLNQYFYNFLLEQIKNVI